MQHYDLVRVAAEAMVDVGTVGRYVRGEPVRGLSQFRIERALKRLGLPLREPAATTEPREEHADR
jgi:hypothetical protein